MTLNDLECPIHLKVRLVDAYCGFWSCIVKAVNGFLMTQRQMTLKDECGYIMLVNFILDAFLADTVDTTRL